MKIYTKTGDEGQTGLYGGSRTSKSSLRIKALGELDELNAALGCAVVSLSDESIKSQILEIQRRLFDLGSEIAAPVGRLRASILSSDVDAIENSIDAMTSQLPELKAFILPGGSPAAAALHLARTVCRRAERSLVELHETESVREEVRIYVNRLSDWLFTAARSCNVHDGTPEVEWRPRESQP